MISTKTYNFFVEADVKQYLNEWIAIVDDRIISHGKSAKEVYERAKRQRPECRPVIAKIPGDKTMIL